MQILAIDTAGPVIGVALRVGEEALVRTERVQRGSEARLAPWAQELCAEAGIRVDDLDGIAVARGPGAFTGLRVGLATAVGLAVATGCPLWGGVSLASRARAAGRQPVLAMLDARKQRVYAAVYDDIERIAPADVPPETAIGWMTAPFWATGEGAVVYRDRVEAAGGHLCDGADAPAVAALAEMGEQAFRQGDAVDPAALRPLYLREPDAKKPR